MENAKIGGSSTSNGSGNAASADLAGPRNSNEPGNPSKSRNNSTLVHIDPLQNDWRQFECNTWHLEPTVRLISWAGKHKSIDPFPLLICTGFLNYPFGHLFQTEIKINFKTN